MSVLVPVLPPTGGPVWIYALNSFRVQDARELLDLVQPVNHRDIYLDIRSLGLLTREGCQGLRDAGDLMHAGGGQLTVVYTPDSRIEEILLLTQTMWHWTVEFDPAGVQGPWSFPATG
jgi:hypothetical protein